MLPEQTGPVSNAPPSAEPESPAAQLVAALAAVMKLMYWRPRRYGAALTLALTVTYSVYML
ncbi:MAG TPA: hypothetical protein VNO35_25655 [Steroidobacteraceae bacterium]|nr:hypothetical protein [Steroidobacteraceae bacterium]